jgi:hypothetical protein
VVTTSPPPYASAVLSNIAPTATQNDVEGHETAARVFTPFGARRVDHVVPPSFDVKMSATSTAMH